MKSLFKLLFFVISISLLAMSCGTVKYYYQVGEVRPVDDNVKIDKDSKLIYFDENIFIEYYFWGSYGDVYFVVNNNSDSDITIHLDKSFFIRNGNAYDYFQNRVYTLNQAQQIEASKMIVPAKSFKIINQFDVTDFMYRSCDLYLWKSLLKEKEAKKTSFRSNGEILNKLLFEVENSPLLFENRIVYSIEGSTDEIKVFNKFYLKSIQNMPEDEFECYVWDKACDTEKSVKYEIQFAPNRYYIKYNSYTFDSKY